jgi:hypothetical protein
VFEKFVRRGVGVVSVVGVAVVIIVFVVGTEYGEVDTDVVVSAMFRSTGVKDAILETSERDVNLELKLSEEM